MADHPAVTYTFTAGTPAAAAEVNQNFADLVGYLDTRFGSLTSAQIPIANATGQLVGKTISGDITVTNTGVVSIGNNKITNAMMTDNSVDSAEIAADAVGPAELNLTGVESTLGSPADITPVYTTVLDAGMPTAGSYLVVATLCIRTAVTSNAVQAKFNFDTEARGSVSWDALPVPFTDPISSLTFATFQSFDGATDNLRLQALKVQTSGDASDIQADAGTWGETKILRIKLASP